MYYICTSLLYEISQSYLKYLISVRSVSSQSVCTWIVKGSLVFLSRCKPQTVYFKASDVGPFQGISIIPVV